MIRHQKYLPLMLVVLTMVAFTPGNFSRQQGLKSNTCFANSFMIEQNSINTAGTVKRYIDVSSLFAGAYLYENMEVVGSAEIIESFTMYNLRPGSAVRPAIGADHFFEPDLNVDANPVPGGAVAPAVNSNSSSETADRPIPIVLPNSGQGVKKDDLNEEQQRGRLFAFYITNWFDLF